MWRGVERDLIIDSNQLMRWTRSFPSFFPSSFSSFYFFLSSSFACFAKNASLISKYNNKNLTSVDSHSSSYSSFLLHNNINNNNNSVGRSPSVKYENSSAIPFIWIFRIYKYIDFFMNDPDRNLLESIFKSFSVFQVFILILFCCLSWFLLYWDLLLLLLIIIFLRWDDLHKNENV